MSPMPVLGGFGKALYEAAAPLAGNDEANGWGMAVLCGALSAPFEKVYDWVMDDEQGRPGWSPIVDVDRAPSEGLPWIGQLAGARLTFGMSDVDARARIASTDGMKRGGADAIKGSPLPYLTGSKTVIVRERYGSAYRFHVITYASETASQDKVLAALLEQKPAGLVMTYQVNAGQDLQSVSNNHATLQSVSDAFATLQMLADAKTTT